MTQQLGREASQLIERALREECGPTPAELAKIQRSILDAAAVAIATTAAAPLAAKAVGTQATLLGAVGKSSFLSAVAVGMSVGAVAIGGGTWLSARVDMARDTAAMPPAVLAKQRSVQPIATAPTIAKVTESSASDVAATAPTQPPTNVAGHLSSVSDPHVRVSHAAPVGARPEGRVLTPSTEARPENATPATAAVARFETNASASISEELSLLESAQRALSEGQAAKALALLEHIGTSGGRARMLDERLALEALAACQLGQDARAELAARQLAQRTPNSPLLARIRSRCNSKGLHE